MIYLIDENLTVNENFKNFEYLLYNKNLNKYDFYGLYKYFVTKKKGKKFILCLIDYIKTHQINNTIENIKNLETMDIHSNFFNVWDTFCRRNEFYKVFNPNKNISYNNFKGVQFSTAEIGPSFNNMFKTNLNNVYFGILNIFNLNFSLNIIDNSKIEINFLNNKGLISNFSNETNNKIKNSIIRFSNRHIHQLKIKNIEFTDVNFVCETIYSLKFFDCKFNNCKFFSNFNSNRNFYDCENEIEFYLNDPY